MLNLALNGLIFKEAYEAKHNRLQSFRPEKLSSKDVGGEHL